MRKVPWGEALLYGALGYGVYWLFTRSPAVDRGLQEPVLLPKITPSGKPIRDTVLGPEELAAIRDGKAYLEKSGWLKYVEQN